MATAIRYQIRCEKDGTSVGQLVTLVWSSGWAFWHRLKSVPPMSNSGQ